MLHIDLDRNSAVTLTRQLYDGIKKMILNNTLQSGTKLPSTRLLAGELQISRTVTVEAYEQLLAEGYIEAREGSGTYVGEGIAYQRQTHEPNVEDLNDNKLLYPVADGCISFRAGVPDLNSVPLDRWSKLYREVVSSAELNSVDYQNPQGMYELRSSILEYLKRVRGVDASPRNVIITGGAAQAFSLLSFLLDVEDYVMVENPASIGLVQTLVTNGMSYVPIDVDEDGIVTELLCEEQRKRPPKLIITTPSHQFPTGVVLPIKRRIELIKYAAANDAYIVEDDYDSEFRYDGGPIQAMQSIEPDRVIYVGTFSKTFCPAVRLGYMILPDNLIERTVDAKFGSDLHSPNFNQLTMARFIGEGHFERHIRKMKKTYLRRRDLIIHRLTEYFGEDINVSGINAGLHLIVKFDKVIFDKRMKRKLETNGLQVNAVSEFYFGATIPHGYEQSIIIGFGNVNETAIENGLRILREVIDNAEKENR